MKIHRLAWVLHLHHLIDIMDLAAADEEATKKNILRGGYNGIQRDGYKNQIIHYTRTYTTNSLVVDKINISKRFQLKAYC